MTPRILLTAPASGGGKTTVTCALLRALVGRGLSPVAFKCGPDYIDPMFHSEIVGAKARNLDLFFLGEEGVRRTLAEHSRGCGTAVIEGVMGYYDGISMTSQAGAYDLARVTATPAVLVVDGRGAARSLAALAGGFAGFRPDSGIQGVILNRVSPMLYPRLKACIQEETGLTVYGYLPELPDCVLESRHLGLVTAGEVAHLQEKLDRLAAQAEQTLDIAGLLALAETAPPLPVEEQGPKFLQTGITRIAIARDAAFCFYYADALAQLETLGAELVPFSPLTDERLPERCGGLYLGGGYPELYAKPLSQNGAMRQAVEEAVAGGMPCVAECGGFLYLHKTLEDDQGHAQPMVGVIPSAAIRTQRLGNFGYVTLTALRDNLLCKAGEEIPGHEFHYWASESPGEDFWAQKPQSDRAWPCVHANETLYAGFPHIHFCARPAWAARFVAACAQYQEKERSVPCHS